MTICSRYVQPCDRRGNVHHEIHQYPNGKFYNHYTVEEGAGASIAGPYTSLEKAQAMLMKHRPTSHIQNSA